MLESVLSTGALVNVVGKQLGDEVLRSIRDVSPARVSEGELSSADFLHNFLVVLSIEGRNTGQDNVGDNSTRPDIALLVIPLVEHFRSNVVRSAQLLIKSLRRVVHQRRTEVNDFNLVEVLVLL